MDTLRFPIDFDSSGGLAKLREGTDEYIKQLISVALITEPYVLRLTPDFGLADPTFSTVSPDQMMLAAAKFIPEVSIVSVTPTYKAETGVVNVQFIYNR